MLRHVALWARALWVLSACLVACIACAPLDSVVPVRTIGRVLDGFTRPLPVVVWHGLGDSAYAEWLQALKGELVAMHPGLYVHFVALDATEHGDRHASIFGNVNAQVERVAADLASVPALAHGFDAVGFSQGGDFLRAYVERYNAPRVRNLITFGSPHMGITALSGCAPTDTLCQKVLRTLERRVYTERAQASVVVAQYFRDTRTQDQFSKYLEQNHFLKDINNEGAVNDTYKRHLASLNKFVMVRFSDEQTVVPAESAWFAACEPGGNVTVPLRNSRLYEHDTLGLATLDKRGALAFHTCDGRHMHLSAACKQLIFSQYVGRPRTPGPWAMLVCIAPLIGILALARCLIVYVRKRMRRRITSPYSWAP